MIEKVKIVNFKCFDGEFVLDLKNGINIVVGNNEAGKSTILEAIHLALSGMFRGKLLRGNLTQYLFNYEVVQRYLDSIKGGTHTEPPFVLIEVYIKDFPILEGDKCTEKNTVGKTSGVAIKIAFDEKYNEEYESLIKTGDVSSLPIEYYDIEWYSFARKSITSRSMPVKSSFIDVGFSKFQNGSDIYISRIIQNILDTEEKTKVAQAYRKIKDIFSNDISIKNINAKLTDISTLSAKNVELAVDLSSRSTWDGSLITQLDNIPFDFIGKGEQAIIKTELALSNKKSESSDVILIEEPECHVSHTRLNELLCNIKSNYEGKQIIISTHSSFVTNKLGLDNLIMLNSKSSVRFNNLNEDSKSFFEKVSGYDTLRLVLCKKAILVEGDSDELIIQRAYIDKYDKLPIEDGVEVISVGTSFLRFLELAKLLKNDVVIVTDNDGNIESLENKYEDYIGEKQKENIKICYDTYIYTGDLMLGKKEDKLKSFNYNTLEPLLLKANSLDELNSIFGTVYVAEDDLHKYMKVNKTDCALKIFSAKEKIKYPDYIMEAIEWKMNS